MFLSPSNQIEWFVMEEQRRSNFFVHQKYGVFEIDANCAARSGKTPVYFYYSEYPKPIHLKYYAMIYKWARRNGIDKVSKKDIRHSSMFDRLKAQGKKATIEELKKQEAETAKKIDQVIRHVDTIINSRNEQLLSDGKPPEIVEPADYAQYVIEQLVLDKAITKEDADKLARELIRGEITIDDFVQRLKELNLVEILEPIPLHPRRWLADFPTFRPADVFNYIKLTRGLSKGIEKLGLRQVHNLIPTAWVIGIVLAVVLGVAVLVSSGVLNGLNNIKFF